MSTWISARRRLSRPTLRSVRVPFNAVAPLPHPANRKDLSPLLQLLCFPLHDPVADPTPVPNPDPNSNLTLLCFPIHDPNPNPNPNSVPNPNPNPVPNPNPNPVPNPVPNPNPNPNPDHHAFIMFLVGLVVWKFLLSGKGVDRCFGGEDGRAAAALRDEHQRAKEEAKRNRRNEKEQHRRETNAKLDGIKEICQNIFGFLVLWAVMVSLVGIGVYRTGRPIYNRGVAAYNHYQSFKNGFLGRTVFRWLP